MCSGALINPKHDTPLYFETYRSQNTLHIPMRIILLLKRYIWISLFSHQLF